MSNLRMLNKETESEADVEVTWVDQQKINEFSKLNARADDLDEKYEKQKQEKEYMDDVLMELELADEDELIRYKVGDAFVHIPLSEAMERLQNESEKLDLAIEATKSDIDSVHSKMDELKKELYAKFGNAINLERD